MADKLISQERHSIKHGHAFVGKVSPTYRAWAGMIRRCENPDATNYEWYGGRGIKVCDRWRHSFEAFLADMGEKPVGKTLERRDTDGDYRPDNCRWATMKEQTRNKRNNVKHGSAILTDAAKSLGIDHSTISMRIKRGWSVARAMTTPRWHKSRSGFINRGEQHPMSRLTRSQVEEIRRRLASGEKSASLAREFGVSASMISQIKLNQAWIDE